MLPVVLIKPVLFVSFDRIASCGVLAILAASKLPSRRTRPFDLALFLSGPNSQPEPNVLAENHKGERFRKDPCAGICENVETDREQESCPKVRE